jgi:hypothetical protein
MTEPATLTARLRAASEPFAVSAREARPLFLEAAAEIKRLRELVAHTANAVEQAAAVLKEAGRPASAATYLDDARRARAELARTP